MAVVRFQRREPRLLLAYLSDIFYLQVQEEMSNRYKTRAVRLSDILIESGDKTIRTLLQVALAAFGQYSTLQTCR